MYNTMNLQRVISYTVFVNPASQYFWVKLRVGSMGMPPVDVRLNTLSDVQAYVDLLRNEQNVMFDPQTQNLVIAWEPTGDNDQM